MTDRSFTIARHPGGSSLEQGPRFRWISIVILTALSTAAAAGFIAAAAPVFPLVLRVVLLGNAAFIARHAVTRYGRELRRAAGIPSAAAPRR